MSGGLRPRGTGRTVLLVDDDDGFRQSVRRFVERDGYRVRDVDAGEHCLEIVDDVAPDVVVLDLNMRGIGGLETLRRLRETHPGLPVVMLTGEGDVATVVEAVRGGAFDYLQKPPDVTRLLTTLHNASERSALAARVRELERDAAGDHAGMVGNSPVMIELFRQLERVGPSDVTVLIGGESGTGKELVARAIHAGSSRSSQPFVAINCAAIPENLQESELFGHERGAFTGAVERRQGRFEQAHRGTLFLDEVGELSASLQAKLLRVVQEQTFHRVGGTSAVQVDVRILSATHRNLHAEVEAGRFREDLYYRLAVYEVEVPPLRARSDDIPRLAARFLDVFSRRHGHRGMRLSAESMDMLVAYEWPGNVRELQNAIERAVVSARGDVIEPADLHHRLRAPSARPAPVREARAPSMRDLEREAIEAAMTRHDGNVCEVVRALGIPRSTLYRRLRAYGMR